MCARQALNARHFVYSSGSQQRNDLRPGRLHGRQPLQRRSGRRFGGNLIVGSVTLAQFAGDHFQILRLIIDDKQEWL